MSGLLPGSPLPWLRMRPGLYFVNQAVNPGGLYIAASALLIVELNSLDSPGTFGA